MSDRLRDALRHGLDSVGIPSDIVRRAKARRQRRRSRMVAAAAIGLPMLLVGSVALGSNYWHTKPQALSTPSSSPTYSPDSSTPSADTSPSASPTSGPSVPSVVPSASPSKPATPRCDSSNSDFYATTDKASYALGNNVKIALFIHNRSATRCGVYCSRPSIRVTDTHGQEVWSITPANGMYPAGTCYLPEFNPQNYLDPGDTYLGYAAEWSQGSCPSSQSCTGIGPAPGNYLASGSDFRFNQYGTPAAFTIGAGLPASPSP